MMNVVKFPDQSEDVSMEQHLTQTTEAFAATGRTLSEFIKGLSLSAKDNNKLIDLILAHVEEAKISGWIDGYLAGIDE